jgi:hypothetical protein
MFCLKFVRICSGSGLGQGLEKVNQVRAEGVKLAICGALGSKMGRDRAKLGQKRESNRRGSGMEYRLRRLNYQTWA